MQGASSPDLTWAACPLIMTRSNNDVTQFNIHFTINFRTRRFEAIKVWIVITDCNSRTDFPLVLAFYFIMLQIESMDESHVNLSGHFSHLYSEGENTYLLKI